jgi:hypothetical protein
MTLEIKLLEFNTFKVCELLEKGFIRTLDFPKAHYFTFYRGDDVLLAQKEGKCEYRIFSAYNKKDLEGVFKHKVYEGLERFRK